MSKICTKCKKLKPLSDFHPSKVNKDGRTSHCKDCRNEKRREYGKKNKEILAVKKKEWDTKNKPYVLSAAKAFSLKWRYGITTEDYQRMMSEQNGVCKICGEPPGKLSLAVDHDHKTGKVRGLLCGNCNFVLGNAKDNPEILRKAANYLEEA